MTEPGSQADSEQAQKATEASQRQPSGFDLKALPQWVESAHGAWSKQRAELNCEPCVLSSDQEKRCKFRGQDVCKLAGEIKASEKRRAAWTAMQAGKVPKEHHQTILTGKILERSAVIAAREIVRCKSKLAILSGGNGPGKSFGLSLAIAYGGGLYIPASSLDPFGKTADDLVNAGLEAAVLAIDDVGMGRSGSDVCRGRIEHLICTRWDAGQRTIVSTNLLKEKFARLYGGDRLLDRLDSDPLGWVRCIEPSLRTPPKKPVPSQVDPVRVLGDALSKK